MSGFFAVLRHELNLYKASVGTYVFIILAVIASVLCSFYLGGLLNTNTASFTVFFSYQPWIFLFFVPVFVMGVWSNEWRSATAERLFTLPVSPMAVTLAKFVAAWSVFALLLVLMIGTPLTVMYLGNPQMSLLWSGYLASFLLGGLFIAVSFVGSAVSRSQTGGASLSLVLIFALLASGWGLLTNMLIGFVSADVLNAIVEYSLLDIFRQFVAGVVSFKAVVYLLSLIMLFLAISHIVVRRRLGRGKLIVILPSIILFVLVNWGISASYLKWDLTEQKIYTLSDAAEKILNKMGEDEDLKIRVYYSNQNAAVPPHAQAFMVRAKDTFKALRDLNPSKVTVAEINPEKDIETELATVGEGIEEVPSMMGESFYMGVTFTVADRTSIIPVLDPSRADHIEYDVLSAINGLFQTKRHRLAILTSLNLGDDRMRPRFMSELMANYHVDLIGLDEPAINPETDLVIVFMTPHLSMESVYALDQYMTGGGHVMLFLDPYLRTAPTPDYKAVDRNADNLNIDHPADLLRHWGVEYDYSSIVGDHTRAVPVEVNNQGVTTYPLWLFYSEKDINTDVPFLSNLTEMFLIESGGFERRVLQDTLNYYPLLETSENGQTVPRYLFDKADFKTVGASLKGKPRKIATSVMLNGLFNSAFKEVPKEVIQYYQDFAEDPSKLNIPEHMTKATKPGALVAIADMDFLTDEYAIEYQNVGGKEIFRPKNDNLIFVFNAIQYLLGDSDLVVLRGKGNKKYPFERIEKILEDASMKYESVEKRMVRDLMQVSQKLEGLKMRQESSEEANEDVTMTIQEFHKRELELRKELRELRHQFRSGIETLSRQLIVANLTVAPVLIALYALIFFYIRRRRALT